MMFYSSLVKKSWLKDYAMWLLLLLCLTFGLYLSYSTIKAPEMASTCPVPKAAGNNSFYSQYLEDYILSIIFKQIKQGFYIDVGASDPNMDSVTKYFYVHGWRGINIEPIHQHYLELVKSRPEDVNINLGVSDKDGSLVFSVINSKYNNAMDQLSTFDAVTLEQAMREGYTTTSFPVNVTSLDNILTEHPLEHINFIKIDVEGMEAKVLRGIDLSKHRPWMFIIEALEPRTIRRADGKWKGMLIQNGYHFAMFDGLNVYYVAKEHENELKASTQEAYDCASVANQKYHIFPNSFALRD